MPVTVTVGAMVVVAVGASVVGTFVLGGVSSGVSRGAIVVVAAGASVMGAFVLGGVSTADAFVVSACASLASTSSVPSTAMQPPISTRHNANAPATPHFWRDVSAVFDGGVGCAHSRSMHFSVCELVPGAVPSAARPRAANARQATGLEHEHDPAPR